MSARQWIDVVLALGICDSSGHVESCGYSENDGACFCITLPARLSEAIEPILAAERERIARAVEALFADRPCSCATNTYPGYVEDEGWEPNFRGDHRELTGYGYLVCGFCDGDALVSGDPTRGEIQEAIASKVKL